MLNTDWTDVSNVCNVGSMISTFINVSDSSFINDDLTSLSIGTIISAMMLKVTD